MLLSEVIATYLSSLTCKRPESVAQQIRHCERLLGALDARELTGSALGTYRKGRRAEGVSDSTINRELTYLRAALRRAHEDGKVERLPHFRLAKEPQGREGSLKAEELDQLLLQLKPDIADLVEAMFATGWRKRAVQALQWCAYDPGRRTLTLADNLAKNGKAVIFPVAGRLAGVIDRRLAARALFPDCPFIFHRAGKPIVCFKRDWRRAVKSAFGDRWNCPHDLRRSFAYAHIRARTPQSVVMQLGGWSDFRSFQRYAKADIEALRDAVISAEVQKPAGQ